MREPTATPQTWKGVEPLTTRLYFSGSHCHVTCSHIHRITHAPSRSLTLFTVNNKLDLASGTSTRSSADEIRDADNTLLCLQGSTRSRRAYRRKQYAMLTLRTEARLRQCSAFPIEQLDKRYVPPWFMCHDLVHLCTDVIVVFLLPCAEFELASKIHPPFQYFHCVWTPESPAGPSEEIYGSSQSALAIARNKASRCLVVSCCSLNCRSITV